MNPASNSFLTSTALRSNPQCLLFWMTGLGEGLTLSLYCITSGATPSIFDGSRANTSWYSLSKEIIASLIGGARVLLILTECIGQLLSRGMSRILAAGYGRGLPCSPQMAPSCFRGKLVKIEVNVALYMLVFNWWSRAHVAHSSRHPQNRTISAAFPEEDPSNTQVSILWWNIYGKWD